ncbi:MAG TPA: hypothetical protein VIW69_06410 [Candidatus Elarobacter sp.]
MHDRTVALRPGTIIHPTGLRLAVGMDVTIVGYNAGRSFLADEIDAPYAYGGQVPAQDYNYEPYGYGSGLYDALPFVISQPENPPPPPPPSPSPVPNHNTSRGFEQPSPQHPTRSVDTGGGRRWDDDYRARPRDRAPRRACCAGARASHRAAAAATATRSSRAASSAAGAPSGVTTAAAAAALIDIDPARGRRPCERMATRFSA